VQKLRKRLVKAFEISNHTRLPKVCLVIQIRSLLY
jgi:hypothetical protein